MLTFVGRIIAAAAQAEEEAIRDSNRRPAGAQYNTKSQAPINFVNKEELQKRVTGIGVFATSLCWLCITALSLTWDRLSLGKQHEVPQGRHA